ncbi:dTDP-4-dehydrorhamnose 3,5-epimerase family protein [Streptosporangium sp. NPDC020072]|uniref:dTDP-4-dehydrorhamnose 3,5-epimerase family protein n=1 Tax=unclassified Streptosporangium TaxID=2632669 RepID=UPI0034176678
MRVRELKVEGAYELTPEVFGDERGFFLSPYQEEPFVRAVGRPLFPVAQASHSRSRRGVVRGVHFTATPPGMAKYAYCAGGVALDVVLDTRVGSPTYGVWDSVVLDQRDFRSVYLPVGVGHLFVALEDDTAVSYLLSTGYVAENELAVSPLDPALGLPLPRDLDLILSERDRRAPTLAEAERAGILPDYAASRALDGLRAAGHGA